MTADDHSPLELREGERIPLTATAGGKAILSYLPADERRRLLDERGLSALTEQTIPDRTTLLKELQGILGSTANAIRNRVTD